MTCWRKAWKKEKGEKSWEVWPDFDLDLFSVILWGVSDGLQEYSELKEDVIYWDDANCFVCKIIWALMTFVLSSLIIEFESQFI